jgi:hypothetical protein
VPLMSLMKPAARICSLAENHLRESLIRSSSESYAPYRSKKAHRCYRAASLAAGALTIKLSPIAVADPAISRSSPIGARQFPVPRPVREFYHHVISPQKCAGSIASDDSVYVVGAVEGGKVEVVGEDDNNVQTLFVWGVLTSEGGKYLQNGVIWLFLGALVGVILCTPRLKSICVLVTTHWRAA